MNFSIKRLLPGLLLAATLFAPVCHASAQEPQPANTGGGRLSSPEAQSPEKDKHEEDENEAYRHSPTVQKLGAMVGLNTEQAATAFTFLNFVVLAVLVGGIGQDPAQILPDATRRSRKTTTPAPRPRGSARLNSVEQRLSKLDE
jgi:F-type H+-transporting ATPase subunit b